MGGKRQEWKRFYTNREVYRYLFIQSPWENKINIWLHYFVMIDIRVFKKGTIPAILEFQRDIQQHQRGRRYKSAGIAG
jgi:hypothetical protein